MKKMDFDLKEQRVSTKYYYRSVHGVKECNRVKENIKFYFPIQLTFSLQIPVVYRSDSTPRNLPFPKQNIILIESHTTKYSIASRILFIYGISYGLLSYSQIRYLHHVIIICFHLLFLGTKYSYSIYPGLQNEAVCFSIELSRRATRLLLYVQHPRNNSCIAIY